MNRTGSRLIMGTAIGAAAIAVVIDHTRQRLPEPQPQLASQQAVIIIDEGEQIPARPGTDCSQPDGMTRTAAPCSL